MTVQEQHPHSTVSENHRTLTLPSPCPPQGFWRRAAKERARGSQVGGGQIVGNLFAVEQRDLNFAAERNLLQEMLIDTIECWQVGAAYAARWDRLSRRSFYTPVGRRYHLYREADFWIFGEYDNAPFFSFTKVCDHLGVDPDFIRRRLLEWRRKEKGVTK